MSNRCVSCYCAAIVLLVALRVQASSTWALPASEAGDWSVATNWTGGVPTSSATAYVINGGTASITLSSAVCSTLSLGSGTGTGALQMSSGDLSATTENVGDYGTGSFVQSGGTNSIGSTGSLELGLNPGSNGFYSLSGSGRLSTPCEYVGYSGTGNFMQSSGTNAIGTYLYVGYASGGSGAYSLDGGSLSAMGVYVGYNGTGNIIQTGGTSTVTYDLNLGYGNAGTYTLSGGSLSVGRNLFLGYALGSAGTFALSAGGTLSAANQYIGTSVIPSSFQQTGGWNSTSYLSIAAMGTYALNGGTLKVNGNLVNAGLFDGGGGGSLVASNGILDLSQGTLQNVGSMSVSVSANTLLIMPASFDLAHGFGSLSSSGLVHNSGTALTVPAGQGFGGQGSIGDPVACQGTIAAISSGTINLNNGLSVSGTGTVNLRNGNLTVNDTVSGITGGSLSAYNEYVGSGGTGAFAHSGGTNTVSGYGGLYLGNLSGSSGSYTLSQSGRLSAPGVYVGYSGIGTFVQTGGTGVIAGALDLGYNSGGSGTYNLNSGSLSAYNAYVGDSGTGNFTQSGGTTTLANSLEIGYVSSGSGTCSLSNSGQLSAYSAYVGYSGLGSFSQTGGTTAITNSLYLGTNAGSSGTLNLNSGSLSEFYAFLGYSGTACFTQSGGSHSNRDYFYLGYNAGSSGTYVLNAGSLSASVAYVGNSGTGSIAQSGGINKIGNSLYLGANAGSVGTYSLSGGSLSASDLHVGYGGTGIFAQSGGTISDGGFGNLYLGGLSGSSGTYALSGGGMLSAYSQYIGNPVAPALFKQTGGLNSARYMFIATGATYWLSGGTLTVNGNLVNAGLFDGGGGGSLVASNGILDLSQGTLQNVGSMSVSVSANTLLIVPANFNLASGFGSLRGPGLVHNAGTTLTVPAGQGFGGQGTIGDPVICQGTIFADLNWPINLSNGINVSGGGFADLEAGTLTVNDPASGISGGSLWAANELIGTSAANARFQQIGGSNSATCLSIGPGATYLLSAGSLNVSAGFLNQGILDGGGGSGSFNANGIVDLSQGTLQNVGSTSLTISGTSLLVVPAGFNPATVFGHFSFSGLTHSPGTTLTVSAGQGFSGQGSLGDLVVCQGAITALGAGINLNNGLAVSGTGNVQLGQGNLTVSDTASGMTGGQLSANCQYVGGSPAAMFTQSAGSNRVTGALYLSYNPGDDGTYNLGGGSLSPANIYAGYCGAGNFFQSGGTNAVGNSLYLGQLLGSSGAYALSGSGRLSASYACLGNSGSGSFTQSGGTGTIGRSLSLGCNPGGVGNYLLYGSAQLSASTIYVGSSGTGSFSQSGGTVTTSDLVYLGYNASGSGTYNLSGSGRLSLWGLCVGNSGAGSFNQSAGTNSVSNFYLGNNTGGTGIYGLSGGSLSAVSAYVGYYGTGSFTQSGGTNSISSYLYLSYWAGSSGTYELDGGLLSASNVALMNSAAAFTQSGGTNKIGNWLTLGSDEPYTLSGGSLWTSYLDLCGGGAIGFTQSGGTDTVAVSILFEGHNDYNLTGGLLVASGLKSYAAGAFNFSGGTLRAGSSFQARAPIVLSQPHGNAILDTAGYSVALTYPVSGPGDLILTGSGTLSLATTNTYTGDTMVNAGTLLLQSNNALPYGTSAGNLSLSGALDLNGYSAAVNGLSGNGIITSGNSGYITLTVGGNDATSTFGGMIQQGDATSLSLVKTGSGALLLSGSNSFTGGAIVAAGTLILADNDALPDGDSLTVQASARLILAPSVALAPVAVPLGVNASTIDSSSSAPVSTVPEPGTLAILLAALSAWRFSSAVASRFLTDRKLPGKSPAVNGKGVRKR